MKSKCPPILYVLATALEQAFVKFYFSEMLCFVNVLVHSFILLVLKFLCQKYGCALHDHSSYFFMDINNRISCTDGVNHHNPVVS